MAAWECEMLWRISSSQYADVCILIDDKTNDAAQVKAGQVNTRAFAGSLDAFLNTAFHRVYKLLVDRQPIDPSFEEIPWANQFPGIPVLNTTEIDSLENLYLDVLYRPTDVKTSRLEGELKANLGVWYFHFGRDSTCTKLIHGFREVLENRPVTVTRLVRETFETSSAEVLYESYSSTDEWWLSANRLSYVWKTSFFLDRKLRELTLFGTDRALAATHSNSETLPRLSNLETAKLLSKKIGRKFFNRLSKLFFDEAWVLLFSGDGDRSKPLSRRNRITPPRDVEWADPHVVLDNNRHFVFFEEIIRATQKGHIAVAELFPDGTVSDAKTVIERDYHMSYPSVFMVGDTWYMIPETSANKSIDLYRSVEFPFRWELEMTLMEDVRAYDATIFFKDDVWWLFANVSEDRRISSWDELYLFYSSEFPSSRWEPHPLNPIVSDCRRARPAGPIIHEDGRYYRPSQDCSRRYGYRLNLNEIVMITKESYSEENVFTISPDRKTYVGVHTYCQSKTVQLLDAIWRRRKPWSSALARKRSSIFG